MIKIKEAVIHNIRKNGNQDLFVTIQIKKEDYSPTLEDDFYIEKSNGSLFAVGMQKAEYENTEQEIKNKRNKDLVYLNVIMQKYTEKEGTTLEGHKQALYKKFNITSRTQLSDKQLKELIESYRFGLDNSY